MKKKKRIFELNLKRKPTKRISLIGLNRNCIIFKKNKLSSKKFREKITHYITIKKKNFYHTLHESATNI